MVSMDIAMRLSMLAGMLAVSLAPGRLAEARQSGGQGFVPHAQAGSYASAADQQRLIAAVEKRYNAKVVRVAETSVNGRPALKLRLLSAQRVFSVVVDAETGQVLTGT
jgi:uncharacterized membrane protein YkoI